MQNNLPYESLQCHTTYSDGDLSHEQVLDQCLKHGIGIMAFTDHDALLDKEKFDSLIKLKHEVKFVSATELTVNKIDRSGYNGESMHVVGIFVDPTNKNLVDYCVRKKQIRVDRTKKRVQDLKKIGFDIDFSDVEKLVSNGLFGSAHLSNAVVAKEKNRQILDGTLKKLQEESKNNEKLKNKLDNLDPSNYFKLLFELYVGKNAYIPAVGDIYDFVLTLDQGVKLIRDAGGLAIFAHWSDYQPDMTSDDLEKLCREKKFDGLETVFGYGHTAEWQKCADAVNVAKKLNQKYKLVSGGGGDFHTLKDFDDFENPRNANLNNDTIGMTEKILDLRPDLNLTWSSLSR